MQFPPETANASIVIYQNDNIRCASNATRRIFVAVWENGKIVWSGDENKKFTSGDFFSYYETHISCEKIQRHIIKIKKSDFEDNIYFAFDIEPIHIYINDRQGFTRHITSFDFDKYNLLDVSIEDETKFRDNTEIWKKTSEDIVGLIPTTDPVTVCRMTDAQKTEAKTPKSEEK